MTDTITVLLEEILSLKEENKRLLDEIKRLHHRTDNGPKLSKEDVKNIRLLRSQGHTVGNIAELYDVNKSTISRTLNGIYH